MPFGIFKLALIFDIRRSLCCKNMLLALLNILLFMFHEEVLSAYKL